MRNTAKINFYQLKSNGKYFLHIEILGQNNSEIELTQDQAQNLISDLNIKESDIKKLETSIEFI